MPTQIHFDKTNVAHFHPSLVLTDELVFLDIPQLAQLIGISKANISKAVSGLGRGVLTIPTVTRFGGSIRFRLDHVKEWIDKQAITPEKTENADVRVRRKGPGRPPNKKRELMMDGGQK